MCNVFFKCFFLTNTFIFQLSIECYDSAYPLTKDVSTVTITVRRNISPPIFTLPAYTATIPETYGLGIEILQVTATDSDGDRITYSIRGDQFGNINRANEYYYIGADSGIIYLKKPLTDGAQNQDDVSACFISSDGVSYNL